MKKEQAQKKYVEASELCRQEKYAEALVILRWLDQAFPDDTNIVYARAKCLAGLGRVDESLELCRDLSDRVDDPRVQALEAELVINGSPEKAARASSKLAHFILFGRGRMPVLIAVFSVVAAVGAVILTHLPQSTLVEEGTSAPPQRTVRPVPASPAAVPEPAPLAWSEHVVPVDPRRYEVNHSVTLVTEERRSYDSVAVQIPLPVDHLNQHMTTTPKVRIEPLMDRFVRVDEPNPYFTVVEVLPYGAHVLFVTLIKPDDGQKYTVRLRYTVEVSNLRINGKELAQVPYSRLAGLDESIAAYLEPEKLAESDRVEFREVCRRLFPSGIDRNAPIAATASTIYGWVLRHCIYTKNTTLGREKAIWGALDILNNRRGECGEYAALFVAVCRAAGIPARAQTGFLVKGANNGHVWAEFYVPEFGWIPVDPSMGDTSPGRSFFAQIPDLNRRVSVTHGFDHILGNTRIHSLQSYNYWLRYSGSPAKVDASFRFTAVPS